MSVRIARVNDQIREELSRLLLRGLRAGPLGFVTITEVKTAPDLRSARVYVSVLGNEAQRNETLHTLTAAAGYLRAELGRALSLRTVPQLRFLPDLSLETGSRIDALLDSIRSAEEGGGEQESAARPGGTHDEDDPAGGSGS